MLNIEREAELCTAQANPELAALIAEQARDARSRQWKHNPGLNDETGGAVGRRWRE